MHTRQWVGAGVLAAALLVAGLAEAGDRYVSPTGGNTPPYETWGNAATSIQTAINAASAALGEKVWVTNATYTLAAEIALNKDITVAAFEPGARPVVNGNGAVRCFNLSSSGAVLDGFVVSNGYHASQGGGILMSGGTVRNCDIVTNTVPTTSGDVYGGGIRMNGGLVSNCTIRLNYCDRRYGGVAMTGAGAKLVGCTLAGNGSRTWPGAGAGLEVAGVIEDCLFTNNVASGAGGGVYVLAAGSVVRNCRFVGNQGSAGGGVSMVAAGLVSNCVFVSNNGTGEGGAMYIDAGLAVSCTMRGNTAGGSGGGGTMTRGTSRAILRNCLIYGNTATAWAGGVISISAYGLVLENCTIADNNQYGVFEWVDNAVIKTNSIVYFNTNNPHRINNWAASCTTPAVTGADNIVADPLFVNRAGGDYALAASSPCVDKGLTLAWSATGTDLAGGPRLARSGVDMGAYEYNPPPPSGVLTVLR